jgi:hypothetical protein
MRGELGVKLERTLQVLFDEGRIGFPFRVKDV